MPSEPDVASPSRLLNGLHIVCPDGDGGSSYLEEPRGSRSSRSRSTRGRFVIIHSPLNASILYFPRRSSSLPIYILRCDAHQALTAPYARCRSQPFFIGVAGAQLSSCSSIWNSRTHTQEQARPLLELIAKEALTPTLLSAAAGGTASGKTTVCNDIMQRLHDQACPCHFFLRSSFPKQQVEPSDTTGLEQEVRELSLQCVVMLSQDSFYRGLTPEELADVACEPLSHLSYTHLFTRRIDPPTLMTA